MSNFTQEDLLQYLYKETSREKTAAIRTALASDWTLQERFQLLVSTQNQLDSLKFSPRQQTIDAILNYADKAVEELTQHA